MPTSSTHTQSIDLEGTWSAEVHFTEGPLAGEVIHHESYLFANDGIMVQLRERRGIGEWKSEGDSLSFAFYEVLLNDSGKPNGVVHVTANGTLTPERSAFEAVGRGDVYELDGELLATNHTSIRGWRADPGK